MQNILVAGHKEASLRCGLRLASDLSVACGARISLVRVLQPAATNKPVTEGTLSDPLFEPWDWRTPIPRFADTARLSTDSADESWDLPALIDRIKLEKPSLVVACEASLARALVAETSVPVWHLHTSRTEREWFTMRRVRCATVGPKAEEWAQSLAASLGAELVVTRNMRDADVTVSARGDLRSAMVTFVAARAEQPVIIV